MAQRPLLDGTRLLLLGMVVMVVAALVAGESSRGGTDRHVAGLCLALGALGLLVAGGLVTAAERRES